MKKLYMNPMRVYLLIFYGKQGGGERQPTVVNAEI